VKAAAEELMDRHQGLPSLQAYRYACGLSQDQAAVRYNEVAEHRTSLGGTTVNAWETWSRGGSAGSPPSLSSLLVLAAGYGRGPLGSAEEAVCPEDLVGESQARLAPEDRVSLRALPARSSLTGLSASPTPGGRAVASGSMRLATSAAEVSAALLDVVHGAEEYLVAAGSRSREPGYLREIEQVVRAKPQLVHYRILIGPPHSQILKDHLLRLLALRPPGSGADHGEGLQLCLLEDLMQDHERFFTASEREAVVVLPSANSPANFDTALVVDDPWYARRLVEHGQAVYGGRILDTPAAIRDLQVLR
jgi:hypothetical protein